MPGSAIPTCLLLLAALSAATTTGLPQEAKTKIEPATEAKDTATQKPSADMASQETKKIDSDNQPSNRQIRKFDFDDEFAKYLGLASQDETTRFLSGDKASSYKQPNSQDTAELNVFPQLRLAGSTPASFAYFTQIYPDEDAAGGDIRIEHFNPVTHPRMSGRENAQLTDDFTHSRFVDRGRNFQASDTSAEALQTLQPPPTSRSYFGRLSSKPKTIEFTSTDFVPKLGTLHPEKPYKPKDYEDAPDYKTGYKQFGMYHKFTEEDIYPKKASTEWISAGTKDKAQAQAQAQAQTQNQNQNQHQHQSQEQNQDDEDEGDANDYDDYQDDYADAPGKPDEYHVKSEHDDEVSRIKDSIENDPPYASPNFDLLEKQGPAIADPKAAGKASDEEEEYGKKYAPKAESAESSGEAHEDIRKHRRPGKHRNKHNRPHFKLQPLPAFRAAPNMNIHTAFPAPGHRAPNAEYKGPSFEFRNPVHSFVSPPYTPPQQYQVPPAHYQHPVQPFRAPLAPYQAPPEPEPYRTAPEHYRAQPENDASTSAEGEPENSYEEQKESSGEAANADTGSGHEPEDLDDDYHAISEAGQKEHAERTKELDERLPAHDGKLYGSFEAFDSQLEPNKKFDPFVQYPFERERKQLKTAVDDLIEDGKIGDRSER